MRIFMHLIIVTILLYTALVFNPYEIIDDNIKLWGYIFFVVFLSNWIIEYLSFAFQGCRLTIDDGLKNSIIASQSAVLSVILLDQYYETDDISMKYLLICTVALSLWLLFQAISYFLGIPDKCYIQKLALQKTS